VSSKIRWVMPVIILLAAAGISWWSAKTESAVVQHIRDEVIELIPLVRENPTVIERMVIDPILYTPVGNSLAKLSEQWSGNKNDLFVSVTTGDDPKYGDGTATHVALVGTGEQLVVGLRIVCGGADEPMYIAGVWTP
jgi:hypothetical protein